MSDINAKWLVGKVIKNVSVKDDEVVFDTIDNETYRMFTDYSEYAKLVAIEDSVYELIGKEISSVYVDWDMCDGRTVTYFEFYAKTGYYDEVIGVDFKWVGDYSDEFGMASEAIDFEKVEIEEDWI